MIFLYIWAANYSVTLIPVQNPCKHWRKCYEARNTAASGAKLYSGAASWREKYLKIDDEQVKEWAAVIFFVLCFLLVLYFTSVLYVENQRGSYRRRKVVIGMGRPDTACVRVLLVYSSGNLLIITYANELFASPTLQSDAVK